MRILNFSDVDGAGKRLCELEVAINKINGEVTDACNEIKERRRLEIEKLESEKKYLEQQITAFCEENKGEFADKRSKDLAYIEIGYKISHALTGIPRIKDKLEKLINAIKSYKFNNCIKYEETIDKDELLNLDDSSLAKLGLKRQTKDNFRIKPKIEALQSDK